ncbi:DeoR/GlpR transcriptional regulator [Cohaesibacter sp. CAU 1516]|nr:DeoR/GlpR transcriptional regulator [Cohaesibacter sp. CAU 1516]
MAQTRQQMRLLKLAKSLEDGRALHLKDAASLLDVSEMTIRRDIAGSDGQFSFLGGYIVSSMDQPSSRDYFLQRENFTNVEAKREACASAASLIEPGDIIFIDCGTTLPYLAKNLAPILPLTIICYSINIADIVCRMPNAKIILLGGEYHPASASFASDESIELLAKMGINKAFISAGGLHFQNGLTCSNFFEVRIKQMAMSRAESNILVMDSTKIGKVRTASFATIDQIDILATDSGITAEQRELFATLDIDVRSH